MMYDLLRLYHALWTVYNCYIQNLEKKFHDTEDITAELVHEIACAKTEINGKISAALIRSTPGRILHIRSKRTEKQSRSLFAHGRWCFLPGHRNLPIDSVITLALSPTMNQVCRRRRGNFTTEDGTRCYEDCVNTVRFDQDLSGPNFHLILERWYVESPLVLLTFTRNRPSDIPTPL